MDCPDDELFACQLRGGLDAQTAAAIDEHVLACSSCRELMVELARVLPGTGGGEPESSRALAAGDRVGRYVIVGTLGRGSMGIVYRAEDRELRRSVAIKVVSPSARDGRARMLREAQAMARLEHPNVVRVFDVGRVGTDVFVAMELVEGGTLGQWLRHRTRTRVEVLAMFGGIARGLAAAHEAGVVHRDVKPENVLVRTGETPLVADFGLARGALDESPESRRTQPDGRAGVVVLALTASDAVVGTPRYMAPEQLVPKRRVDERSDQFAFCVMLFDALYGVHPFPASTLPELRDAVLAGKITIPTDASVPADLRRLVVRGLAVDPRARWPSMRALADALQPRLRRSVAWTAAGGAIVLASALAWGGSDAAAPLCEDPNAAALERSTADIDHRIDARVRAWSESWVDALRETCAAADRPQHDVVVQCLLRRRTEVEGILDQAEAAQPSAMIAALAGLPAPSACARTDRTPAVPEHMARAVAEIRGELDRVRAQCMLGGGPGVLAQAAAARDRAERLGWDPLLAEAHVRVAVASITTGDDAMAEAELLRAVEIAERSEADAIAVEALVHLADVLGTRGSRFDEGMQAIRHAQSILDRGADDPRARVRMLTVEGRLQLERHDFAASRDCATRALAAGKGVLDADDPLLLEARSQLAMAHMQLDALDEAEQLLREVLAAQQRIYGEADARAVTTLVRIGIVLKRQHREREAVEVLERALAVGEAVHAPDHPDMGMILSNLGLVHLQALDLDAALPELARALAIYRAVSGDYGPRVATLEFHYGEALRQAKRFDEALPHLERARVIESELYGPDDARTIATHHAIAGMHLDQGEYATAEVELKECLAATARAGAAAAFLRSDLLSNLAHALHRQGRLRESEAAIRESIELAVAGGEEGTLFFANKQHALGEVLLDLEDRKGAAGALVIAVELRTRLEDPMLPHSQALLTRATAGG